MYPNHTALLDWLHARDIFTSANLHDNMGVSHLEKRFGAMSDAMGGKCSNSSCPFHITDIDYAQGLHRHVLAPLAAEGLDFWCVRLAGGRNLLLDSSMLPV